MKLEKMGDVNRNLKLARIKYENRCLQESTQSPFHGSLGRGETASNLPGSDEPEFSPGRLQASAPSVKPPGP